MAGLRSVLCINRAGHGCSTYQTMDVLHIKLWMWPISGHGCIPYQVVDVLHISSRVCPMSLYGCAPYTVTGHSCTCFSNPLLHPLASRIMLLIYSIYLFQPLTHKTITCVLLVAWFVWFNWVSLPCSRPRPSKELSFSFVSSHFLCRKHNLP